MWVYSPLEIDMAVQFFSFPNHSRLSQDRFRHLFSRAGVSIGLGSGGERGVSQVFSLSEKEVLQTPVDCAPSLPVLKHLSSTALH